MFAYGSADTVVAVATGGGVSGTEGVIAVAVTVVVGATYACTSVAYPHAVSVTANSTQTRQKWRCFIVFSLSIRMHSDINTAMNSSCTYFLIPQHFSTFLQMHTQPTLCAPAYYTNFGRHSQVFMAPCVAAQIGVLTHAPLFAIFSGLCVHRKH